MPFSPDIASASNCPALFSRTSRATCRQALPKRPRRKRSPAEFASSMTKNTHLKSSCRLFLAHRSIVAGAVEHLYGMRKKMRHSIKGFGRAFGAAQQVDDEGLASNRGGSAREHGGGRMFQSFATHLFGNAGNHAVGDGFGRFGSIVARADSGSAGGQQNVHASRIRKFAQLLANPRGIIGNPQRRGNLPTQAAAGSHDGRTGAVFALAFGHAITDGENGYAHEEDSAICVIALRQGPDRDWLRPSAASPPSTGRWCS